MSLISILSFTAAMLVLAVTPGPGVFAVLGRALNSGFRKSLFLIAGIVTGDLIYLSFALSGLTWLAQNVNWIFTVIRIAGGLYLIYLGVKAFFSKPASSRTGEPCQDGEGRSPVACYGEGLIITLSNPKVILFYCSFLPAFIDLGSISGRGILIIACIVCATLSLVMTAYSLLAVQTGRKVQSQKGIRNLNRTSGGLMAAAGTVLILKH